MLSRLSLKTNAWLRIASRHWQPLARSVKVARYSSCLAERRRASSIGPLESRQSCVPPLHAQTASAGKMKYCLLSQGPQIEAEISLESDLTRLGQFGLDAPQERTVATA